jgi:hypothetical protein
VAFAVWVSGADRARVERVADAIADHLATRDVPVEVLDSRTPGADALGGRAVVVLADALARHGVATIVALPLRAEDARATGARMIEVHACGGERPGYEAPERPEVELEPGAGVERVVGTLEVLGFLPRARERAYTDDEERQVIRRLKAFGYL